MRYLLGIGWVVITLSFAAQGSEMKPGMPVPPVEGKTLAGQPVSLEQLLAARPRAVVLLLFSPGTGDELAWPWRRFISSMALSGSR